MVEPWHIPRASLGSVSSGNSRRSSTDDLRSGSRNRGFQGDSSTSSSGSVRSERPLRRQIAGEQQSKSRLEELKGRFDGFNSARHAHETIPKRGSRSSQGSTDSNHSSHVRFYFI